MKITNIRVYNNYKVKLINAKLSSVDPTRSIVSEQGTRTPDIPTPAPIVRTFEEKYAIVFDYLIQRYEPGWSAADPAIGKAATMALLGVSAGINPLILGGTAQSAFQYVAYPASVNPNEGWFDPLTHPKNFAAAVKAAYKVFGRARSPSKAKHKFVDYVLSGLAPTTSSPGPAGNMFFCTQKEQTWYPDKDEIPMLAMNSDLNYKNCIERTVIHSPYGHFNSPMNKTVGGEAKRSFPWMNDRYTGEGFCFDALLHLKESTTLRDLLNDHSVVRDANLGIIVDGVTDIHLNTNFRGMCYPAGAFTEKVFGNTGYPYLGSTYSGFSADQVVVGSPWLPYPNGVTWNDGWWGGNAPGLCFDTHTMIMFDGSTFPENPPEITDRPVYQNTIGISYGYGLRLLQSLDDLSSVWGNSMEFIAYLGYLPFTLFDSNKIPWAMFADPTIAGNAEYTRWRLDASVSHWKEKFRSPIDGFAHVFMDAAAAVDRTYHTFQPPGFTAYQNIASTGVSYVENTAVSWARDQYNFTYGPSGPNGSKGVVLGTEVFAQYMFIDDVYEADNRQTQQKKSPTDPLPRHWCLDEDIATPLFTSLYDLAVGQRKRGFTYANQVWGMGICGSSTLGELFVMATPETAPIGGRPLDAYPFFYNTFIQLNNDTSGLPPLEWKRIPGTLFNDNLGVPWEHDRRFRLFYLYPTILALNGTVFDQFHNGFAYYFPHVSGWFDITLGSIFKNDMEALNLGSVVDPETGRRTPAKPPQNFWTGNARTSEFELLYACMKGGLTAGLDSLHFTKLYNELDAANVTETQREGYFRALDYAVYGAAYFGFTGDTPSIVPIIKPTDSALIYYRGSVNPGSSAGMPTDQYADYRTKSLLVPTERRVFLPIYWLLDGPATQRPNDYFFKQTADGTTYTGSIPGVTYLSTEYGGTYSQIDTSPLKFNTPWAYVNRQTTKESFNKFLTQSKADGLIFSTINDDSEALNTFNLGGFYNNQLPVQEELDAFVTNSSWLEVPDARRLVAIVGDSRFNGITNSVTNRTLAQEFKFNYDNILQSEGQGLCGASAEAILGTYFTDVTNRIDFKPPWGVDERLFQYYAWDSSIYTFCHGDLRSKIIGDSLDETTGFSNVKKYSSDVYAMSAAEAKFATDLNGHRRAQVHIPGYGHEVHCYGQLSGGKMANGVDIPSGIIKQFGYPPGATTDEATRYGKSFGWHPFTDGGITFGCPAYQAVVSDVRRLRGILRTRPQAYQDGIRVWINGSLTGAFEGFSGDTEFTQFYAGNCFASEYYKEHFYHMCLNGVEAFHIFNSTGSVSLPNELLLDWKIISGNTIGIPCTNATGATGATIDRIDLFQAGTNMVISGAYVGNTGTRLWRMTAPPDKIRFTKTSETQTDLPARIPIPSGSRGVWLEAPASYGMPEYQSE